MHTIERTYIDAGAAPQAHGHAPRLKNPPCGAPSGVRLPDGGFTAGASPGEVAGVEVLRTGLPTGIADASSWQGTSRYEVIRFIGRGGMGAVYEANDRERNRRVAVKTLVRFDPGALYLFKQEFRTLANLLHPNLVRLYDLVASEAEGVFFTMELVQGRPFCEAVWRPGERAGRTSDGPTAAVSVDRPNRGSRAPVPALPANDGVRRKTPADVDRLRDALRQLAEGVHAAHVAGKVHRDIKPSNVLVAHDGRVVLLDFGVAGELSRAVNRRHAESNVVGTPVYMAPEQALDETLTPASDWYSVGALLYEALVGRPPFDGDAGEDVLYRKAVLDPPAPSEVVDEVPPDLDALCCELLRREPGERPNGRRVLRRLGVETRQLSPTPLRGNIRETTLVGRSTELRALHLAYVRARTGGAVIARVRGASGMGKSALVHNFLDGLVTRTDAVVLRGCAYERESIAYKAVDGVVDALSRYLVAMGQRGETMTIPAHAAALAHLFPVLRRVPGIVAEPAGATSDPLALRQRAFGALREILSQLARKGPTILHLDDVQWGDVDSATLLIELMRAPDPPPLMVILGHRDGDDAEASPFLVYLREHGLGGVDVRDIPVSPLGIDDARRLALNVLGSDDEAARRVADAIAHGSNGSAFFVEDLARSAKAQGLTNGADAIIADAGTHLDDLIRRRIARLEVGSRELLELAAVHGRPLPLGILQLVGGAGRRIDSQTSELRERHFLNVSIRDGLELVETTHDRIREAVVAALSPGVLRERHRQLATAYEREHDVNAEALVDHWFAAGETERAVKYAERAAQGAMEKLAFDRAVELYRLLLAALPPESPDVPGVRERLGEALAAAGRGLESAREYLEAARTAPIERRAMLERVGANQLLFGGQIDEGSRLLRRGLARSGRGAPGSALVALVELAIYNAWLRARGLHFTPREPEDLPPRTVAYIDALYAAVLGLALVDVVGGGSLIVRFLVVALRTGHRAAIAAAALLGAGQLAARGGPESDRERALVALAARAAEAERQSPSAQSAQATHAFRHFLRGKWRQAHDFFETAYTTLPPSRDRWNQHGMAVFGEFALVFLGELELAGRRLPRLLADAEQRGDVLKIVNLSTGVAPMVHLAGDDPGGARRVMATAFAHWPQPGFLIQHWRALLAQVDIDLYEGHGMRAHERMASEARAVRRSFVWVAQYVRALNEFARARAAIAASFESDAAKGPLLHAARRSARKLASEGLPWTSVLAAMVEAARSNALGDREGTVRSLQRAADRAETAEMALYAAAARHRLGTQIGGTEGTALRRKAEETMRAKGVRAPERFAAIMLPGHWPPSAGR